MKQNKFTGDRDDRRHTSMDSDENDYQGRGLPYALPKFDFDEGNLRFDSLVENEVFLGIPSQDDNQWIEDFSRGSSGIDFTSSAPDSCSIPRHNNVWSEATSSESVEMLLKSVGQEEMILEESLVRDSNTRNELPSSDQMDTDFMHNSKIGDLEESSCGTPPAQFLQDFSPLNKAKPENISSSHGFEPVDVCAGGVGGEKTTTSIIVTEENLPVNVKGDDENAGKDCNLFGESSIDKFHDDNIALSCLSSDPITGSGIPSGQNKVPDISSENLGLPVDTNIVGGHGASDISFVLDDGQVTRSPTEMHTSVVHSAVCVASETEVWSENAVKTTSNIEQSPMLPPQGNSGLPAEEGCKSEVFSPELTKASSDGCVVLTEGTGNEPESESKILCGEKPCAVIKGDDGCSREQSSVVSEIGNECGNEQSFAVCNNDQCIVYPELEKESAVPKVMSGRVMDGDDAVGVHGASGSSFMLDDGQAMESPTPSVLHSAAYVTPEKESVVENADKTTTNTEQSPMLPPQDNSTLHIEEGCKSGLFSPDLTMVSIDDYAASSEGTDNQLQSESKDLCSEKSCAVIEVDDGCSTVQSSVVSEIGNACGSEQSFAASNNDQCVVYPELEKQSAVPKVTSDGDDVFINSNSSKDVDHVEPAEAEPTEAEHAEAVVPKVMSGRVMDGDDAVGVHGASGSSFMLDDGQAMESPTPSVLHSAAYVTPEKESVVENADKTTTNIEQSPMLPLQDNSTLHTEEGCKSGLFSPDLTMVSIDDYAAPSEGTDNQLQSESKDLCSEKSCAVIEVDDGCNTVQSSVVSEIGNACGNEQSGNNDQCVVYPELEKQSAVLKVTSDGDDDVFISSNSSKEVDHVEPVEAEPTEAEHAEAVQEPNDVKLFNVPQERNDGNLTSDLVNKNSETHEVIIISAESTQSVNDVHVQPTEADSSPKPSTGMSTEQDYHDGNPINVTRERNGETLASESGNANSERDESSFNSVDITKSMDHLESTESSPLKLITGMSAEPDSHDRKPVNVMQKSTDESMTSDAINTNFKIVVPVDDGNNAGARSSNNATEEIVESTGGADFGPHTEGETGSLHEVGNFPSVPLGADTVVKSIHQNEDQISQTMPSEASISDNKEDKKDTATVEASMVDIDEKMKQGPDVIVVKSAPSAETKAKDVNQSMDLVELHGGQTNVEQVMTEVVQNPCGAESVSPPAFSSPVMHDQKALSGGPKGTSERKTRRGSGKLAKGNPAKGNCSKEVESKIQRDVGNTLCVVLSPSSTVKPMPLEAGSSALKPTAVVAQSSNLPDLNTSTSTAVLFRQPFTDLQQVQLRAQIFVYGSLIQGAAPDEACMVSAFGTSDGGRSIWEPAWRACIQRLQKSHLSNPETPVQSRSGAKALDQVTKTGLSQRKSRVSSNGNSSSVVTAIIPLSSPLWNISTPSSDSLPTNTVARSPVIDYQTLPPLHGYQTPASRNYAGHTRVSQAPFPVPWMASPQASPYNVNAHIAPPQPTEIVKLTTVKASPAPSPSTMNASSISVGQEKKKGAASYAPHSVEPKSRKRKKVSVSENLAEISYPVAPGRTESFSVSVTPAPSVNRTPALGDLGPRSLPHGVQVENAGSFAANSQFLASATTPIPPGPGLKSSTEKAIAVVSPVSSVDHSARSHQIPEKRALSLDEVSKVDAKLQAEQASAHAVVVSPVVDHLASSQITEKRALSLDEVAKVDAKLQAEQASAHAAVSSRVIDHPASSRQFTESRALSLDEVAKVEEAKLHAEQASAHAAAAVSHCQNVWLQLGKQNSSNLMSDSEAKLASAAACIAAAASVAKAASAAAKVASTVALQAKLMADEALIPNRCLDTSGFANETGSATPASILKAGEGANGSSSIIYAAREAARKRVEAASAASKHAENLDAIVKAAELAAEAVAQAGKIVALGDPFPLSKLVEGGPAGYWKDTGTLFSMGTKSNIVTQNNQLTSVEEHPDPTVEQSERPLDSISQAPVNSVSPDAIEKSKDLVEVQVKGKMATSAVARGGELEGLKSPAASKTTKTVGVVPESESGLRFSTDENMAGMIKDSRISVSSLVEVFKGNGDLTGAWFSATVSSLKSGKALVSYKDLETDQGRLMEWVPLEAGTRKPPVIRLAHPMTSLMFDGNRKRRREVVKDYNWSVGDRVDAWLENCWSEGVVVEKNKKDDTTLSVHFPAQGKTIPVKAWHLRPSLIWTDGEWIESLSSENDKSSQGDTPKEKRMKLGSPTVDDDGGKGKEKITKIMDPPESRKFEESRLLPLSAKEKSFHIGSTKNDKPETLRTMRSGLQREGPKVVFGVPKPGGKKRKFMDVSKHCVSSRNTNVNANTDKEKSARHLVPEGGAYGWKYSSKVVDVKEKQAAEPRTRNFKPTKPPSSFTRTLPQKGDKSLIPSVSGSKEGFSTDNNRTDATSNDDSSDHHTDFVSSSNVEGEEPISSSSRAPLPRTHRKMPPSNAKSERLMKGKPAFVHGKPNKVEVEKEKSVTDSSEPRRSNRKIQPTSRLLEGLQSSLIMSKTPLVSHEKSHKGQKFGAPRGMRS